MRTERVPPKQRQPGALFVLLPIVIGLLAILNLQVPYLVVLPGPVEEAKALVRVEGAPTYPSDGSLYLTTVVLGPTDRRLLLADYLRAKIDSTWEVVPFDAYYPSNRTPEEIENRNRADIEGSKVQATSAALRHLGHPVHGSGSGVLVRNVQPEAPAAAVIREGDVIVSVGEQTVCAPEDLLLALSRFEVGQSVDVGLIRGTSEVLVEVTTVPNPNYERFAAIGVVIEQAPVSGPVDIQIESRNIGGPSAGLMFALAIADLLEEGDLTGGRSVAGTGTITCDGRVGAVGGLPQKIASAEREGVDLFIVPADEVDQACRLARRVSVAGASTLQEAVSALSDPAAAARRSCPRAEARSPRR